MVLPAHAPWRLQGECIVGIVVSTRSSGRGSSARSGRPLPADLRHLPGPALVIAVRYTDSPVGPYLELAVGEPARLGLRPGLCITTMVVTSLDARVGGTVNWGFPKELGTLEWSPSDTGAALAWKERGVVVRGRPIGVGSRGLPVLVPMPLRAVQHRSDGPVLVPARCRGWARPARVEVAVDDAADPLAGLAGTHWGALVGGLRMTVDPARHPTGLLSTLRAPLRAPEPALSWETPRAYGSVG